MYSILTSGNPANYLTWVRRPDGVVEIVDIAVESESRRKGVGRWMVNQLLDKHLPEGTMLVIAVTRIENQIAQQFYEKLRFRVVAVLRDFYDRKGRVDAIMYGYDVGSQA